MKIELEDIQLSYGSDVVLDNLTLTFDSSKLSCLLGRSGSGKTSILKIIAGILPIQKGKVYFDGRDITDVSTQKRNVGWVPQQQLVFPGLNVKENISYGLRAREVPREVMEKHVAKAIELVGLDSLVERDPSGLSGGERQRVALARAIAPQPDVLLLDEPFSSLDAPERDRLSLAFRQVQLETGVTTIHVTHAPREAELLSDTVYILSHGDILQNGRIDEIQNHPKSPEVAKLLNIPNFIESNQQLDIHQPTIIPRGAITIQESENGSAKVLSRTSKILYLQIENTILEVDVEEDMQISPGTTVRILLDRDQITTI